MDLAVILPLAVMLGLQALIGFLLLLPRSVSKPVASLLDAASANPGAKSAMLTVAGAVAAMTVSSLIQLMGVLDTLKKGSQFGDRCGHRRSRKRRSAATLCASRHAVVACRHTNSNCVHTCKTLSQHSGRICGSRLTQPTRPSPTTPLTHYARALALTVEELRALLALVLGVSNLVLMFLARALASEQLAADKAKLNLEVLQRQVRSRTPVFRHASGACQRVCSLSPWMVMHRIGQVQ